MAFTLFRALPKFWEAFQEGKELADAATWKNRTVAANACVALFGTGLALAKICGYDIQVDQETVANLGAGIVAFVAAVNAVMHVVTSKRVGLSGLNGNPTGPAAPVDGAGTASGTN